VPDGAQAPATTLAAANKGIVINKQTTIFFIELLIISKYNMTKK
jgi:hypothetical protein